MDTLTTRRMRPARKLERPVRPRERQVHERGRSPDGERSGERRLAPDDASRMRHRPVRVRVRTPRPTRGPQGQVEWWERPAPGGHEALWAAVRHLHERRQQLGLSVAALARRLHDRGYPIARETLSRVLNGKQPTSWPTVEVLADLLGADLPPRDSA